MLHCVVLLSSWMRLCHVVKFTESRFYTMLCCSRLWYCTLYHDKPCRSVPCHPTMFDVVLRCTISHCIVSQLAMHCCSLPYNVVPCGLPILCWGDTCIPIFFWLCAIMYQSPAYILVNAIPILSCALSCCVKRYYASHVACYVTVRVCHTKILYSILYFILCSAL